MLLFTVFEYAFHLGFYIRIYVSTGHHSVFSLSIEINTYIGLWVFPFNWVCNIYEPVDRVKFVWSGYRANLFWVTLRFGLHVYFYAKLCEWRQCTGLIATFTIFTNTHFWHWFLCSFFKNVFNNKSNEMGNRYITVPTLSR